MKTDFSNHHNKAITSFSIIKVTMVTNPHLQPTQMLIDIINQMVVTIATNHIIYIILVTENHLVM